MTADYKRCCRLCFDSNKKIINMFDQSGLELKIASIISTHFQFVMMVPTTDDEPSEFICTECWWYTDNFHRFYNSIEILHKNCHRNGLNTSSSPSSLPLDDNNEKNDFIRSTSTNAITLKDRYGNFRITTINHCIQSNKEKDTDIDLEMPTSTPNIIDNTNANISRLTSDNLGIFLPNECIGQKIQTYHEVKQTVEYDKIPSTEICDKIDDTIKSGNENNRKRSRKMYIKENIKNKLSANDFGLLQKNKEDTQIREYFQMDCEMCNVQLQSFPAVKMHYRDTHNIDGYIKCCDRKFFRRGRILDHILHHLNPEAYKCKYCNKTYSTKSSLKYHLDTHETLLDKPYKCESCTKSFLKLFQLTEHRNLRHANTIFTCDICSKSCKSKLSLFQHIKNVHTLKCTHMCDICAKVFKTNQTLKYHRTTHFDVEEKPKVQCNICGVWLKHERILRTHMIRHKDTVRKCPKCDKIAPNRYALRSHMRAVHSEMKLICTLCNKSFKRPIGLKEHLASHTGEVLYTCPHCPKTFVSGANMHSHRKKAHPIQWQENRGKRVLP